MQIDDSDTMTFQPMQETNRDTQMHTFDSAERDDKSKMFSTYARVTSVAEWRQLAAILDRMFLILFTLLVVCISFTLGS